MCWSSDARREPPHLGHAGSDDLDDRLLPDRALGAQALRVRADPAAHRLAPAVHPAVDRGRRERARRGAAAARGAPQANRGRARPGRGDPRRGAQDTGVDGAADARGDRGRATAPARGHAEGDRRRDCACAPADQSRGRRPHARGGLAGGRSHARRRARPGAHLRGDCRARLLASRGIRLVAVAHRIYAEALFGAAKDAGRLAQVHEALGDFAAAAAQSPELRAVLRNPQLEPSAKGAILSDLSGDEEPLFAHFLQVVAEKGRAGELEEIAKEFERLMAREERRLTVELTTARELTDAEAQAILKQIEDAAGRKVEATQKVDPDLVGGIVLQAGSLRVDASVRGRLERLRTELVKT